MKKHLIFGFIATGLAIGTLYAAPKFKKQKLPVVNGLATLDKYSQIPVFPGVSEITAAIAERPQPVGTKRFTYTIPNSHLPKSQAEVAQFYTGKSIFRVRVGNFTKEADGQLIFKNCAANVEDGLIVKINPQGNRVFIGNLCEVFPD